MSSIEEKALQTYEKNLAYFKQEHESVFKKLSLISQAIENGSYHEKYALEYKDNYFDVLELSSQQYLYGEDSNKYSKHLIQKINFKKSDAVVESFYRQTVTDDIVNKYEGNVFVDGPLYATAKIIQYANNVRNEHDEMKFIDKFIFAGVGLGLHLKGIKDKIKANKILIVENNLELFRLSLFVTDYETLSQRAELYFAILNNDDIEFQDIFHEFHKHGYNNNQYIKFSLFSNDNIKDIEYIQYLIITTIEIAYPYSSSLQELLKAPEYILEGFPFIDFVNRNIASPLSNKPAMLVAAGPSLNANLEWLQKNQDKFFIISVLAASKTLYKAQIKPDVLFHIDPRFPNDFYDTIDIEHFFDQTVFLFSSIVSREAIESFPKNKIYFFESVSHYKKNHIRLTAPSVGETAYAASLLLGIKELYLLGLDLALDPESKRTHSEEHTFSKIIDENESGPISLEGSIQYVKGNFIDKIPTLPIFNVSITEFKVLTIAYKKDKQTVFNLSNGAFLEGTIPLHIKDFNTNELSSSSKNEKFKSIEAFFTSISESAFSKKDIESFEIQIQEAQRLLFYVQNFKEHTSTTNFDIYMRAFLQLTGELIKVGANEEIEEDKLPDINKILYKYLYYITGYIFNLFNTKNLKNQKRHLKKINIIFIGELEKMLNLYITTMLTYKKFI